MINLRNKIGEKFIKPILKPVRPFGSTKTLNKTTFVHLKCSYFKGYFCYKTITSQNVSSEDIQVLKIFKFFYF